MTVTNEYLKVYGEPYLKQIEELEKTITYEENKKFKVINFEAGTGKTQGMIEILNDYLSFPDRKFLIVTRFNSNVREIEEKLSDHKRIVLAITSDNWNLVRHRMKNLHTYFVIIITHERYIRLCREQKEFRKYFEEDRHTLIIDEKVDFPIFSISKELKKQLFGLLKTNSLQTELNKVFEKLDGKLEYFESNAKGNQIHKVDRIHFNHSILDQFISHIEANRGRYTNDNWNRMQELLRQLEGVYNADRWLYNHGVLSGYVRDYQYWGLRNNAILDATGDLDSVYRLGERFEVFENERIIDHSKCTITFFDNFKSSKGNIINNQDSYFEELARKIKKHNKEKVLLVIQKPFAEKLKNHLRMIGVPEHEILIHEEVEQEIGEAKYIINWFGNLIGRNQYSNLKQCWVLGTPNLQFQDYAINYIQYSGQYIGNMGLKFVGGKFKNNTLREIQNTYLAKELYQSMKRIARNPIPKAEWFVVLQDIEIANLLVPVFKDISICHDQLEFVTKIEEVKRQEVKNKIADSIPHRLIDFLKTLENGQYSIDYIAQQIGIDKRNISRYYKNKLIKPYIDNGNIKTKAIKGCIVINF